MSLPVVTGNQTSTLAWFAELAYENSWTTEEVNGWHLVSGGELGVSETLLSSGHYAYQNASALVTSANFNGSDVLSIAFRGSDDVADWITNITDIDEHFELFAPLTSAATGALDAGTYDAILVTGHSLGGAMTEVFMHTYPQSDAYGISWGSPGIHMDSAVSDQRLINYVFTDDGVAWLGTQRDDIADEVNLWSLGDAASLVDVFGLPLSFGLVAALNDLGGDYHHQGTTALIDTNGTYVGDWYAGLSLDGLEDYTDTHDMGRYLTTATTALPQNPFALPDSTVSASQMTEDEKWILKMYDTVFDGLPSGQDFASYTQTLATTGDSLLVAASMLDASGLRSQSPSGFVYSLFDNVAGRAPTTAEFNSFVSGGNQPAQIVVKLAGSAWEDTYFSPTLSVVDAMGTYDGNGSF